jgi:hypothetical protein
LKEVVLWDDDEVVYQRQEGCKIVVRKGDDETEMVAESEQDQEEWISALKWNSIRPEMFYMVKVLYTLSW